MIKKEGWFNDSEKEELFNKFLPLGFVKNDENFYEGINKVLFLVYQKPVSFNNLCVYLLWKQLRTKILTVRIITQSRLDPPSPMKTG